MRGERGGAVFKVYDEPLSPNVGAGLRLKV